MSAPELPPLYSEEEVASYFRVTPHYLQRRRAHWDHIWIGREAFYTAEQVHAIAEAMTRHAPKDNEILPITGRRTRRRSA